MPCQAGWPCNDHIASVTIAGHCGKARGDLGGNSQRPGAKNEFEAGDRVESGDRDGLSKPQMVEVEMQESGDLNRIQLRKVTRDSGHLPGVVIPDVQSVPEVVTRLQ